MKKIIILSIIAIGLFHSEIVQGQGTLYLSNLGQPSTGSLTVGSDSWLAIDFFAGSNVGGYLLNSVQLTMSDAAGNPSGFTAMLYTDVGFGGPVPGSSLGTLNGSLNPAAGGIYTYTPASSITLSQDTSYFIVLTANTAVANGAYELSAADTSSYSPIGGWGGGNHLRISNNGSSWNSHPGTYPLFAINATPVPEPGILSLLGLGGAGFLWRRWQANTGR